jgi:hypothetical protein
VSELKSIYYIWLIIFTFTILNFIGYKNIDYSNEGNVFFIVFLNMFCLLFATYPYLRKLEHKVSDQELLNFLDVSQGKIKFPNITNFLGEQALGSLFATLTIVYGREIFEATKSGALAAIFVFIAFLMTITITTLSLTRVSLQIINLKYSHKVEFPLIFLAFFITYWLYIGGLNLAPTI